MDFQQGPTKNRDIGAYWNNLQSQLLKVLDRVIPPASPVVYVDYPVYGNVGDLLIYLGAEQWMEKRGLDVQGRWTLKNFPFPPISDRATILCQGGGNFGDLYPHQKFRERVVRMYPINRIVFLPQTIHFKDSKNRRISAEILNAHRDLHIFARDRKSLDIASSVFSSARSYLSPDMAVFLYPLSKTLHINSSRHTRWEYLYLLRRDIEKSGQEVAVSTGSSVWRGDWQKVLDHHVVPIRFWQGVNMLLSRFVPADWFSRRWKEVARRTCRHGAAKFLKAKNIVSDRLHGHILASLLGIPNVLLDNSYGKNSWYYSVWNTGLDMAAFANAPKQNVDGVQR